MHESKSMIINVQTPEHNKALAVVDQLERLLAENEIQHNAMVEGAKNADKPKTVAYYEGMQAAYAHYSDGLNDALKVIRQAFELEESNETQNQ